MISKTAWLGIVAGMLLAASDFAAAQGDSWYIAGNLGASFANDSDNTQMGFTVTSEFDTGVIASVAGGHTFGGFRAEGELAYIQNDVSSLEAFGTSLDATGDVGVTALMANVYYDFNTDSKWKPYIGAGIGYSNISIDNLGASGVVIADDSAGAFAYQLKAGIGYAFTDSLDGTLGYRFFGTADADFVDTSGFQFNSDGLQTNIIEIGVRYRF